MRPDLLDKWLLGIIILTDGLFIGLARHWPMERANWASPFLGRHSGLGCFIGPASPLWPGGRAPIFKPHHMY